jgi:hypothetical protein
LLRMACLPSVGGVLGGGVQPQVLLRMACLPSGRSCAWRRGSAPGLVAHGVPPFPSVMCTAEGLSPRSCCASGSPPPVERGGRRGLVGSRGDRSHRRLDRLNGCWARSRRIRSVESVSDH